MEHLESEPDYGGASHRSQQVGVEDPTAARWAALAVATTSATLCQAWLELQARQLGRARQGLVLIRNADDGAFVPVAIWPDPVTDVTGLVEIAQRALTERRGMELRPETPGASPVTQLALPIETAAELHGVAVIALDGRLDAAELQQARRQLFWGSAWLSRHFLAREMEQAGARADRAAMVLDLTLSILEKGELQEALLSLVNGLAVRLDLRRASLGLERKGRLRIAALSHTASFKGRSESVQRLERAQEEAYDQQHTLIHPPPPVPADRLAPVLVSLDHQRLAEAESLGGVASFLFQERGRPFGVLTLEYPKGKVPDADDQVLGEALGRILAPVLRDKRELDHWVTGKLKSRARKGAEALFGPYHATYKLAAILTLAVAGFLAVAEGEFRITAKTVIEGLVQRAAVAPFEGYIGRAPVRAGDSVEAGQVVATLDDKDLLLEKARLTSELEQVKRKYRDALAKHDRASGSVLSAELSQIEAELNLAEEKLTRSTIRAPFAGIVVSGDLSQMLGAPVEQGKVLFEIAPLDAYRVILKVDERDIAYVQNGMHGRLALAGLTADPLPFVVKKTTPVATAEEGVNYFRVEAELERASLLLRPGMEGVGKIGAGERKLWWIWTRRFRDWLVVSLWTWLP